MSEGLMDFRELPVSAQAEKIGMRRLWESSEFLVVVAHTSRTKWARLTIMRLPGHPKVHVSMSWELLMQIKQAVGLGYLDALEVYPATKDAINTTNGRHLWLIPDKIDAPEWLDFIFRDGKTDMDHELVRLGFVKDPEPKPTLH